MAQSPLSFGIEEEFLLIDPLTRDVLPEPAPALFEACREAFGEHFCREMFLSQIELRSPILHDLAAARQWLGESRQQLARLAAVHDIAPLCVGAHPFADWRRQRPGETPRQRQLHADYRDVALSSLLCGLHVHVGVPPEVDRIHLLNQLQPWLPLLLALSASSPFWEGRPTGLVSQRRNLCSNWPRMNLPPRLDDEQAFQAHVVALRTANAIREPGQVWWCLRPSQRFHTLELRISDACPVLDDALCIAGLFRELAEALLDRRLVSPRVPAWVQEENYWRSKRDGLQARYLDEQGRERLSCAAWLDALHAAGVDSAAAARRILHQGNSAQRQLQLWREARAAQEDEHQALCRVVDMLRLESACAPQPTARPDDSLSGL